VLRGGSWDDFANDARVAFRSGTYPDEEYDDFGFRCARGL
jgi:formylglycine-generating enzyme required for sulfatase activity